MTEQTLPITGETILARIETDPAQQLDFTDMKQVRAYYEGLGIDVESVRDEIRSCVMAALRAFLPNTPGLVRALRSGAIPQSEMEDLIALMCSFYLSGLELGSVLTGGEVDA